MRLGYSPFGQVYRKQNDTKFWKLNSGVNANNQLNQLMPYQYTGRYTEGATGYTNLDARWYNPYTQRFNQPDYWSFNNTGLPKAVQHELMRFTGLDTSQLLRDPSQQMRYGYVAGNALSWVDLMGLCYTETHEVDSVSESTGPFGEQTADYVDRTGAQYTKVLDSPNSYNPNQMAELGKDIAVVASIIPATKIVKVVLAVGQKLLSTKPESLNLSSEKAPGLKNVKDRLDYQGEPNSIIKGSDVARKGGGDRAFITDKNGKIIKEITPQRVKVRITNNLPDGTVRETFQKIGPPSAGDLKILDNL